MKWEGADLQEVTWDLVIFRTVFLGSEIFFPCKASKILDLVVTGDLRG